eukprot:Cvel_28541.t1-p1 / transcript=Cvel_28541.t1 / gene=Cvel_28541 / organism=Chromera_velia_CCMP2878 / gene_product=Coiled-coil domain-containing protein 113, putative / transcript_product=Coiled-coil domain-containing protein 113, putative / location=Cvel_scaffold3758:8520-11997(+) / protein_length=363 / sequence_SO=supercontig / SO=protein_coding / is_pseudo=false
MQLDPDLEINYDALPPEEERPRILVQLGERNDQLRAQVEELQRRNEEDRMENALLAAYLQRNTKEKTLDELDEDAAANQQTQGGGRKKKDGRGAKKSAAPTKLTLEQKYQIATAEVDILAKEMEKAKFESDKSIEVLKALMEETDIRQQEVHRETYEFRRDIVVGAEHPRSGKTMAEVLLKWMEDKLTQKDALISKLLMKKQALKAQIAKTDKQLKSKRESGEDLQYIDFHQLQIENQQFVQRIEEANNELFKLKKTAAKTVKTLNAMKKRLSDLSNESRLLKEQILERKNMLAKTDSDIQKVNEQKENAKRDNKRLKHQSQANNKMPKIVEYVQQKADQYTLTKKLKGWEKKVEIAKMGAQK